MPFFEAEKKLRKAILEQRKANNNNSAYIDEDASPEKVVAATLRRLRDEIKKREKDIQNQVESD